VKELKRREPAHRKTGAQDVNGHLLSASQGASVSEVVMSRRGLLAGAGLTAAALLQPNLVFAGNSSSNIDQLVEKTVARMSLTELLGQMFMFQAVGVEMTPTFLDTLGAAKPGGIIFFGANIGSDDQIKRFVSDIHDSIHPLPPFIAIDEEGGPVVRMPNDPVPGAVELGLMKNKTVRSLGQERAKYLAQFGFDVNFAPVADIAYQADSIMASRSFGNNPKTVSDKVSATVSGSIAGGVLPAAKHFPGHGRTSVDSHDTVPIVDISKKEWLKTDATPFEAAIKTGVEMIMVGHLDFPQWDSRPTSLSRIAIDTLRNDLGFQGVIVTDDLGMGALSTMDPQELLHQAALGGADLLLYVAAPEAWTAMIADLEKLVRAGKVSRKRLMANVNRIVRLKYTHFKLAERAKG
jgi:beta-N-acetylhexosaminidase